jgi:hypothetical protein
MHCTCPRRRYLSAKLVITTGPSGTRSPSYWRPSSPHLAIATTSNSVTSRNLSERFVSECFALATNSRQWTLIWQPNRPCGPPPAARQEVDGYLSNKAEELALFERLLADRRYELSAFERQRDAELQAAAQQHLDAIGRMIDE